MFRIIGLAMALSASPAMAATSDISYCSQVYEAAAARLRWALAHQKGQDAARVEDSCLIYRDQFFEASVTRQTVSRCEGHGVQQTLSLLDAAELDAFNDLIASHCSSP